MRVNLVTFGCCLWPLATLAAFPPVDCKALHTAGFHDYPGGDEVYEAALFHPAQFRLAENVFLMTNLAGKELGVDLYLTLARPDEVDYETELECRGVRGTANARGYSCVNNPPSEMLLINAETLRFTRTAVGGWTFTGANAVDSGDSIYVEYGSCRPAED